MDLALSFRPWRRSPGARGYRGYGIKAMSQKTTADQAVRKTFDVERIESMGLEIVQTMRDLRNLLDARATALEKCRLALADHCTRFDTERDTFATESAALCADVERREAELTARSEEYSHLKEEAEKLSAAHQQRVEELKRVSAESERRFNEAQTKEAELAQREQTLAKLTREVEAQKTALTQDQTALATLRGEIQEAATQLDKERADFEARFAAAADTEADLEKHRVELLRQQETLSAQLTNVTSEREALQSREVELEQLGLTLADRDHELDQQQRQVSALQAEWKLKLEELNAASSALSTLQKQIGGELDSLTEQVEELTPQYGVDRDAPAGAPADAGMPAPARQEADDSIERFQKLCRDAKRRAIGG